MVLVVSRIILATSSPYRQEAFRFLGLDFVAHSSNVDEYHAGRPDSPEELVLYLAKLKAEAVAKNYDSAIVIGFDSVGCFNAQILEKPKSREVAFARLKALSGNAARFFTGIYLKNLESGKDISQVIVTNFEMRILTDSEIDKYLDQDLRFNSHALGFNPLNYYSSTFIKKIEGSYNSLTRAIPLEAIVEMLPEAGHEL